MNINLVRALLIVFGPADLFVTPLVAAIETALKTWIVQFRFTLSEIERLWRDGIE